MRSRTACKSPQKFEVKHLPLIADELKNIVGVVDKLRIHEHKLEKAVLKSIRTGGDIDAIIAKEESSYSEDLKAITDTINIKLNEWRQRELAAIPARLEA
jgi:Asp-tRNA(Asn)/Glu-tRNA(Gln) amidotransferase B subunit